MIWILAPLLFSTLLIELYFGRYKKEELGWNSAVSNSLVLLFVGMNLCAYLYSKNMFMVLNHIDPSIMNLAFKKTLIALFVVIESFFLVFLNFFHLFSKRFAFGISSSLILNFIGLMSIIIVYSDTPVDILTLSASIVLFIGFILLFKIIQLLEPKKKDEDEE